MTKSLNDIKSTVDDWLDLFLKEARNALGSDMPILGELLEDGVINLKGKHMRPLLTMLIAKAFGRTDLDNIISSAVSVELVHIASLIHDDILDEASIRHGVPTANSVVGPNAAVLAGDFVLSRGVYYSIKKGNLRAVNFLVSAMENLVEGELLQKYYSDNQSIDEEGYFKVISYKTSCLISIAARLGAPEDYDEKMALLGEYIGAAFQIKDDMLDIWGDKTGKAKYNDFKEKKITLPLILAMKSNAEVSNCVRKLMSSDVTDEVANSLASIVTSGSALSQLKDMLQDLESKAISIIDTLPDNDARDSLYEFVRFVTGREF